MTKPEAPASTAPVRVPVWAYGKIVAHALIDPEWSQLIQTTTWQAKAPSPAQIRVGTTRLAPRAIWSSEPRRRYVSLNRLIWGLASGLVQPEPSFAELDPRQLENLSQLGQVRFLNRDQLDCRIKNLACSGIKTHDWIKGLAEGPDLSPDPEPDPVSSKPQTPSPAPEDSTGESSRTDPEPEPEPDPETSTDWSEAIDDVFKDLGWK